MTKYLISTTETYRIDNEADVEKFIAEAKESSDYELKKYVSEYKDVKSKGDVVDSWFRVTLTKAFNAEKEPETQVSVSYEVEF